MSRIGSALPKDAQQLAPLHDVYFVDSVIPKPSIRVEIGPNRVLGCRWKECDDLG